jgi:transcription initiation factor TFIIIB Brf1 subunit/transcription initiation factor TFIIB
MIRDDTADTCSKCRSPIVYNDLKGILVCTKCGELKEDRIVSLTSEYRYFNDDTSGKSDPRRVGNPVNMHMDSQIDLVEIDNYANGKKHHSTYATQSNADKNYTRAIKFIKKYCDLLDLPNLQKPSEEIYFEVKDSQEIKGKRLEATIAAIIFLAGRQKQIYVSLKSFENIADAPEKTLVKACNIICKLIPRIVVKASDLVKRYSTNFQIPRPDIEILAKMCDAIDEFNVFDGQRPKDGSIAASVFYYYSMGKPSPHLSLTKIKEVTGVNSDSLIRKYADHLLSKNLMDIVTKNQVQDSRDSRFL